MNKRLKMLSFSVFLGMILGIVNIANAIIFTDLKGFKINLGTSPDTGVFSWSHLTPADLEVPYDNIVSSTLKVRTLLSNGNNDEIWVEDTLFGVLEGSNSDPSNPSISTFDIETVFATWKAGSPLDVSLRYREFGGGICVPEFCETNNFLVLLTSEFTVEYNNNTAPVPEPSSIMLFGGSLAGLVYLRKRNLV